MVDISTNLVAGTDASHLRYSSSQFLNHFDNVCTSKALAIRTLQTERSFVVCSSSVALFPRRVDRPSSMFYPHAYSGSFPSVCYVATTCSTSNTNKVNISFTF